MMTHESWPIAVHTRSRGVLNITIPFPEQAQLDNVVLAEDDGQGKRALTGKGQQFISMTIKSWLQSGVVIHGKGEDDLIMVSPFEVTAIDWSIRSELQILIPVGMA